MPHLSYIGDAEVGEGTNVAAGNITANFLTSRAGPKGRRRSGATSGPAFSNGFEAPVEVGDDAWIAGGLVHNRRCPSRIARRFPAEADQRKRAISVESATTELTSPARARGRRDQAPRSSPEHWIERGPSKRLHALLRTLAPRARAEDRREARDPGRRRRRCARSPSGETYCRYEESIRGADLFIVQTSSPPVDQHLMELLIMIDAAQARLREADHRRHPAGSLLAPGQEVAAARADHRAARRRHDPDRRAPTACSRWISTPARSRVSSTSRSTT